MAISDNILAKMDQVGAEIEARIIDPNAPAPVAQELHDKAVEAIMSGGGDNPAWVAYMTLFAGTPTNPDDLAKLIPTNGDVDPDRRQARAYLVANGMCFLGTTRTLNRNVSVKLN